MLVRALNASQPPNVTSTLVTDQLETLLEDYLVAQQFDDSHFVRIKQNKVPFRQRHAQRNLRSSFIILFVCLIAPVLRRERFRGRRFGRVRNEGGGLDDSISRMELIGGWRGERERAVVDSGTCRNYIRIRIEKRKGKGAPVSQATLLGWFVDVGNPSALTALAVAKT